MTELMESVSVFPHVVRPENPLMFADLHLSVGVDEELRESRGEVLHKAIGDLAQGTLHLFCELSIMMFLEEGQTFH